MQELTRRRFAQTTGAAGIAAVAGCGNESAGEIEEVPGSDFAGIESWLDTDEFGGVASNYEGTLEDHRNLANPEPVIRVGAEGNGGNLAFDPVAIIVRQGITVQWEWTGDGGPHNVVSDPDSEPELGSQAFRSGDPVTEREPFRETAGSVNSAFFYCESHLDAGMKGVVLWR